MVVVHLTGIVVQIYTGNFSQWTNNKLDKIVKHSMVKLRTVRRYTSWDNVLNNCR